MKKISINELQGLLKNWSESYNVFVPDEKGSLVLYKEGMDVNWQIVPVWGSIKEFIFAPRNMVAGRSAEDRKPSILAGARNCDVAALTGIMDKLFLEEEPVDTVYKELRENVRLVTVDCQSPADTCFCSAVGGQPFCEKNFDINISFIEDGIIVETGTEEGNKLIEGMGGSDAGDDTGNRDDLRDTASRKVKQNFTKNFNEDKLADTVEKNNEEKYWLEKSDTCMQCGGCNFCCPSCYCNVLNEVSEKSDIRKVLQWDSCQFPGYARVAGGANPREQLWQRFRNRYVCKFSLMPGEFDMPGCTGCGRCIQVCPGKIDIRETIKGLYE